MQKKMSQMCSKILLSIIKPRYFNYSCDFQNPCKLNLFMSHIWNVSLFPLDNKQLLCEIDCWFHKCLLFWDMITLRWVISNNISSAYVFRFHTPPCWNISEVQIDATLRLAVSIWSTVKYEVLFRPFPPVQNSWHLNRMFFMYDILIKSWISLYHKALHTK